MHQAALSKRVSGGISARAFVSQRSPLAHVRVARRSDSRLPSVRIDALLSPNTIFDVASVTVLPIYGAMLLAPKSQITYK